MSNLAPFTRFKFAIFIMQAKIKQLIKELEKVGFVNLNVAKIEDAADLRRRG